MALGTLLYLTEKRAVDCRRPDVKWEDLNQNTGSVLVYMLSGVLERKQKDTQDNLKV